MNILCIGNSFSEDATRYLHQISGETLNVRNLYIGGCSLERHYNNIINYSADYEYRKNGKLLRMISVNEALTKKKWDYITVQQVSQDSGIASTYEPYIEYILNYVKEKCPSAKIAFHRTWAYSDFSDHGGFANYDRSRKKMFNAIVEATTAICKKYSLDIIPNGDAVEMARNLPEFDEREHPITRDGFHMSLDYGRYLTGLVMYKFFTGNDATLVEYEPDDTDHEICQRLKEIAEKAKPAVI